jgi:hypothetical protein
MGAVTRSRAVRPSGRSLALLVLGGASLLAGLTGALVLLGVSMPAPTARLAASHGLLMTLGFLGTLIALERAVALGRGWGYRAPLAAGLAGVASLAGVPVGVVGVLLVIAGIVYVAMYVAFDRIEQALHTRVQGVGAVAWLVSAVLVVSGQPTASVVPWLAAFLVLTIAGERLELSRVRRLTVAASRAFIATVALLVGGVTLTLVAPEFGWRIGGVGLLALALWLATQDVARRTVRMAGLPRFVALALLAGYGWLAVAGAGWLAFGAEPGVAARDTMLHALFLGFVMSMVFGHAPVILPAVLRVPLPYHPLFYLHLALLHTSLLLRVIGGDLVGSAAAWQWGGVLNVVAVLLFLLLSAVTAARAWAADRSRPSTVDGAIDGPDVQRVASLGGDSR